MHTVQVARRDPDFIARLGEDAAVEMEVGDDLIRHVQKKLTNKMLSTAVKERIAELGLLMGDVLDNALRAEGWDGGWRAATVERFLTNTGLRPLFSPVVEDGIRLGLKRVEARWQGLVAKTVQADSMSYEYYSFDNGTPTSNPGAPTGVGQFGLRYVGQGAPIPVATVSISGKNYQLVKLGRGIEWTDEAKSAPIDLAETWFRQVGIQIGWDYHSEIVAALLNGVQDDNSDDAPVIATAVAGVIDDADLYEAVGLHELEWGYTTTVLLASLTRAVAIQTLENGAGQRLFPNGLQAAGLPPIQVAQGVPDDKVILVDTTSAILRIVHKEFGTEFDRNPKTQVEGIYGTSSAISVPLFAEARVILDA